MAYKCEWCKKDLKTYSDYAQHAWDAHRRDVVLPGSRWDTGRDIRTESLPAQPSRQQSWFSEDGYHTPGKDTQFYKSHSHADWVKVGDYKIKGCGLNGAGMTGIQVALSDSWIKKGTILTTGLRSRLGDGPPMVYVEWPDQGVIPEGTYRALVHWIVARLREGKEVSVGCFGGHGRTGTVIAGVLAVLENLSGKAAVIELRKRYCEKAIETKEQENLVGKAR